MRITSTTAVVLTAAALAAAALTVAGTGRAGVNQGFDVYVHALSLDGRVSVNGTGIVKYRAQRRALTVASEAVPVLAPEGDFVDPWLDVTVYRPQYLWSALVVDGADRYALRRDGRVKKNDADLYGLPVAASPWLDMLATAGHTYAVRGDGALAVDDGLVARHRTAGYHFRRVVQHVRGGPGAMGGIGGTGGPDLYCLRSDGSLFRNDEWPIRFAFRDGADGLATTTTWIAAAVAPDPDPYLEYVYALRADGVVKRGQLLDGSVFGEDVARLPFDTTQEPIVGQLYVDLVVTDDGSWYALAGDGRIYSNRSATVPYARLPTRALAAGPDFVDLAVLGDRLFALRSDGRVYDADTALPLCHAAPARYGSLALSSVAPVLTRRNTRHPTATIIRARVVTGTPLVLPVVATDLDTNSTSLVTTPLAMPAGATWDAGLSALVWNSPGPQGRHAFRFRVSDGLHSRRFTYRILVRDPDVDPGLNTRPLTPSFGRAVACAGQEFVLPVIVDDRDGDPVTVRVNPSAYPFRAGATFDDATRTFRWTPSAEDCGAVRVRFRVSDGRRPRIVTLRLRVKNGLFY